MEKTKIGISVGVFGAIIYIVALFGSYLATVLLMGYVLLMESNEWLKKTAVKAFATLACFSILLLVIGLIPDALNLITSFINIFGTNLYFSFINELFSVINQVICFIMDLVFIALIFKSFNQGTIKLPVVDNLINKYM